MSFRTYIMICLLVCLLGLSGFYVKKVSQFRAPSPSVEGPPVIMEVLDPSLQQYAVDWQTEIHRRFPRAVGILCHGGDFVEGQWLCTNKNYAHYTTVAEVARHYQQLFPDRAIVLLCCNTGHLTLGVPGVYYFHSSVWLVPDRSVIGQSPEAGWSIDGPVAVAGSPAARSTADPEVCGNVFEAATD